MALYFHVDYTSALLNTPRMDKLRKYLKDERGRLTALATALGIFPSAILQWSRVPAERVPAVARATGLSSHDLRPDLYELPEGKKRRAAA